VLVLQFVAGSLKGSEVRIQNLPVSFGRDFDVDVRVEDDGVFGKHAQISLTSDLTLQLEAKPPAFALIEGARTHLGIIRTGDRIGIGASAFRLALDSPNQASVPIRETLLWFGILALLTAQMWFMFKLG